MPTFTPQYDWFSHVIPIWEQLILPLKDQEIHALEIGSFEGRSTVWLLENILLHKNSDIVCVDPFEAYSDLDKEDIDWTKTMQIFLDNISPWSDKVLFMKMRSTDYLRTSTELFDLIYVDGSHAASQALIDGVLSHLSLKPGGIIIFDDYMWAKLVKAPNVPKGAVDAFMECFAHEYECVTIGYQVILKKKL